MIDSGEGALRRLLEQGGRNAGDLARALGVSVPTIMRRIRALRLAGVPVAAVSRGPRGWTYELGPTAHPRGLPVLPARPPDANKSSVGRILVVAGSKGMAGAAALTCLAAQRAGAGLVYLAAHASVAPILAVKLTETVLLPGGVDRRGVFEAAARCRAAAVGPGLSRRPHAVELARHLFSRLPLPAVFDADGLAGVRAIRSPAPRILTPHEGEMAALTGRPVSNRERDARRAAQRFGSIVILKGPATVVTDGSRVHLNPTGNPGLATAGTGDVLTGIIAALLGQGLGPWDAAVLGTWLQGRAGDLAAGRLGQASMIASDLLDDLPRAVRERTARKP